MMKAKQMKQTNKIYWGIAMNKLYNNWLKIEDKSINEKLLTMTEEEQASAFGGSLSFGTILKLMTE